MLAGWLAGLAEERESARGPPPPRRQLTFSESSLSRSLKEAPGFQLENGTSWSNLSDTETTVFHTYTPDMQGREQAPSCEAPPCPLPASGPLGPVLPLVLDDTLRTRARIQSQEASLGRVQICTTPCEHSDWLAF